MARRFSAPYQSEPVSSLATWSRNLAIFAVVAVVVSILIVRFGFLEMKPALATFFGALGCAALSILVGLAAFAAIWQNGSRGMGRILLAFWDQRSTDTYLTRTRLRAYTPGTVTDLRKLRAILAKVATDGYAVLEEEYVRGGSATAAPIMRGDGTVVAALNVGTVSARYPAAKSRIIAGVVRAAASISQRLGHRRAA